MQKKFRITVNGRAYEVVAEELGDGAVPASAATIPTAGASAVPAPDVASPTSASQAEGSGDDEVAPLAGVVVVVEVRVGQKVSQGERLLVLEAMKMKTNVTATRSGEVTRVLVNAGDTVDGGQALVTIV